MAENEQPLDLLSTSQTNRPFFCPFGAPLIAIIMDGKARIQQACCNHWVCPVCGETRAREEYRRIVAGCELLAKDHKLFFWTLTCRGKDCTLEEAERDYYAWTNRLLTSARAKAHRNEQFWLYVQVTERQKKTRLHPHSHLITTFLPSDAVATSDAAGRRAFASAWFTKANASAGLGEQHRISEIASAAAVSRYVGKYLFKATMSDDFPPGWKRVRYSQNFPALPYTPADFVELLTKPAAWEKVDHMHINWAIPDPNVYALARRHMGHIHLSAPIDIISQGEHTGM